MCIECADGLWKSSTSTRKGGKGGVVDKNFKKVVETAERREGSLRQEGVAGFRKAFNSNLGDRPRNSDRGKPRLKTFESENLHYSVGVDT